MNRMDTTILETMNHFFVWYWFEMIEIAFQTTLQLFILKKLHNKRKRKMSMLAQCTMYMHVKNGGKLYTMERNTMYIHWTYPTEWIETMFSIQFSTVSINSKISRCEFNSFHLWFLLHTQRERWCYWMNICLFMSTRIFFDFDIDETKYLIWYEMNVPISFFRSVLITWNINRIQYKFNTFVITKRTKFNDTYLDS